MGLKTLTTEASDTNNRPTIKQVETIFGTYVDTNFI